jgi:hypothetical protein
MKVGAHEGFVYHSVELSLLANGERNKADSETFFFLRSNALYSRNVLHCPNFDLFDT